VLYSDTCNLKKNTPILIAPERFSKIRRLLEHRQPDLTLVMDNVNKAHNLAAVIRSCDSVGINQVHAVSYRQSIRTKQHTAAGASKWVRLELAESVTPILEELKRRGMQLLVATYRPDAVDFRSIDYTLPTAIIMGEELKGPSEEALKLADRCVYIPMAGMVDSLNVSVAAAVILFEAQRQRQEAGMYEKRRLPDDEFKRLLFEYTYPRLSEVLRQQDRPYPSLDDNGAFRPDTTLPTVNEGIEEEN